MKPYRSPLTTAAFLFAVIAYCLGGIIRADEKASGQDSAGFSVHEWSFWIAEPNLSQVNSRDHFPSSFPTAVDTSRSRLFDKSKRQASPLAVLSFYGDAQKILDVDLRIRSGRFLGHWPPADVKANRLRWFDASLLTAPDDQSRLVLAQPNHWFQQARELESLIVRRERRDERFIAYDAEINNFAVPIQLEGGPDTYKVLNKTAQPLYDVLVIAPAQEGRRVGWLDELPAGVQSPAASEVKPADPAPRPDNANPFAPAAIPAAEVPVAVEVAVPVDAPAVGGEPAADVPAPAAGEADEKAAAEAAVVEEKVVVVEAAEGEAKVAVQAAPAAAPAPAAATLVPSPAEDPKPTDAEPDAAQTEAANLEKAVDLSMSAPLAADQPEFAAQTSQSLRERLLKAGLNAKEADLILALYGDYLFQSDELFVLCRLPAARVDEQLPLVIEPEPAKTTRVGLLLLRNLDPKIRDDVQELVARLGDPKYQQREAAEVRLVELGRLATQALKDAVAKNADPEIVFRAERILAAQNQAGNQ